MIERSEVVAAHRELVEASDAVRHLLVVEDLTQEKIDNARGRLARAYERANAVDERALHVGDANVGASRPEAADPG